MKEKIKQLRAEGKSYKEIANIVGCSKTAAIYHSNDDQAEKARIRQKKYRDNNPLERKMINFKEKAFRTKVSDFKKSDTDSELTKEMVFNKITENPICYLTGKNIALEDTSSYHFDHIIPVCKGGKGSLDNLGLASKDANMSKGGLLLEEYLALCKEVLEHNGYKVNKK